MRWREGVLGVVLALVTPGITTAEGVETIRVTLPDGVELATDLYRPAAEPAPVILARTSYGREGLDFLGEFFAARGYVVAVQDIRGKYESSGTFAPFQNERADGIATLRWIAKQPWCNGSIGMWGSSYSGFAALVVSDVELEAFRSIFQISGWLDGAEVIRPGGANHLMLSLPWMLTQGGRTQGNLSQFDVQELFRFAPLQGALRSVGIENTVWEDPSWLDDISRHDVGRPRRPTFHVTGWYDMVYRGTLDAHRKMSAAGSPLQKLTIGPWYHNQFLFDDPNVGDIDFGEASFSTVGSVLNLSLRWFEATLRGTDDGILAEPPVIFFLMGQDAWHDAGRWPPGEKKIEETRWYLSSGGAAIGAGGDGRLSRSAPEDAGSDRFVYDPEDPVPTLGGANFFYFPELVGVRDQREIEKRPDVLVYTSPPLEEELQIVGPAAVLLHASTSGAGTDFTAKLVQVELDGYARILRDGIVRVGKPDAASGPLELTIDLGQIAASVPAGHRLRLEISSSNFPKYDRNPNNGNDPFLTKTFEPAQQEIFHGEKKTSYLLLPIMRKPLRLASAAATPMVEPAAVPASVTTVADGEPEGLLAQGRALLEEDEVDEAVATLEQAVELEPEVSEVHFWLGKAYLAKLQSASLFKKLGLSKKVRGSYLRAIELDLENLDARESLAYFYFEAPGIAGGSVDKGMEQVEEIRSRDPRTAHLLLASHYASQKKNAEAKGEYRAAIALDPEDPDPQYLLGMLFQSDKEYAEAVKAFEGALVADPDDLKSLYQIGRTGALSEEKLERARQALEQYIERDPNSSILPSAAAAHWRLGMVFEHMGHADRARRQYETALELEPELEQARESLAKL
jgi:uncharacterized protein